MTPEIWCVTDGRTDEWMEKVTRRGGCPPNNKRIDLYAYLFQK